MFKAVAGAKPDTQGAAGIQRVLAAEGISNFGSMLSRLAIPWLAALVLLATPSDMALLLGADVMAAALGGVLLGSWVDHSGKRAVMLLTDAARAALLLLLAWATWQGHVSFGLLLAAAAANGLLSMAFELARSAWMAQQVPLPELPRRNAQLSLVGSVSETAAFALGGWLYQGLGAALALATDAFSYALSAWCLRGVREFDAKSPMATVVADQDAAGRGAEGQAAARSDRFSGLPGLPTVGLGLRSLLRSSSEGLRAVAQRPQLRAAAAIETLSALAMGLTGTVYTLFATRELALPTGQLGMVAALGGIGAIVGAALAPRLGRRFGGGRSMALGLAAFALGAACIPMAQGSGWLALGWLVSHQILGDAGHVVHQVQDRTLRQVSVPSALLARTDAGLRSAGQLALLAGAAIGGTLGTLWGYRPVLWLAVLAAAAAAAVAAQKLSHWQLPSSAADQSG